MVKSAYFNPNRRQIKINFGGKRSFCVPLLTAVLAAAVALAAAAADDNDSQLTIDAEQIIREQNQITAKGNVKADLNEYRLCAGTLIYDRATGLIKAAQDVRFISSKHEIHGDSARFNLGDKSGEVDAFAAELQETQLRVTGAHVNWNDAQLTADDATITSCPADSNDWHIQSKKTEVFTGSEEVVMHHSFLHIGEVPVLYLPYGRFNYTKKKKSGFLWPDLHLGSATGFGVNLPYYLVLADNYDLTLLPNYRSKHGLEIGSEFRFLTPNSRGNLQVATAFHDDLGGRGAEMLDYTYQHGNWHLALNAQNVSDNNYLRDYRGSDNKAVRVLPRRAQLRYDTEQSFFAAGIDHFQTLDDAIAVYRAVPQLDAGSSGGTNDYDWSLSGQYARFHHNTLPDGSRVVLRGELRGYHFIDDFTLSPALAAHAVRYNGTAINRSFFVPVARLDAERVSRDLFAAADARDHLRLRAALVYAPAQKKQNDAPLFDTTVREQTSENLFEWNRFVGDDRAGDAGFIVLGGGYRHFQGDEETFFIGAAQRYYINDAEIVLDENDTAPTQGVGDFLLDSRLRIDTRWRTIAALKWDAEDKRIDHYYAEVRGDFGNNRLLYLRYLNDRTDQDESLIFGGSTSLASWLDVVLQSDYLPAEDRFARTRFALRLKDSCNCWNISLAIDDQVVEEGKNETEFSIGFELTGLGGINEQYENLRDTLR